MTALIDAEVVAVKRYPFSDRAFSFLFSDRASAPAVQTFDWPGQPGGERIAVLAFGSNRSPAQLQAKSEELRKQHGKEWGEIPVAKAWLKDFDVVYSAFFARRGYLPATLHISEGSEVEVAITWLAKEQLEWMHLTEGRGIRYDYWELHDVGLRVENGPVPTRIFAYVSCNGALRYGDAPLALSDVYSRRRLLPAFDEEAALALVHKQLNITATLDEFIRENICNRQQRAALSDTLLKTALPFGGRGQKIPSDA